MLYDFVGIKFSWAPAGLARVVANRSRSWAQFVSFLLVLTHMMISALLVFTTLNLLGVELSDAYPLWQSIGALIFFFAALAKEA